MQRRINYGAGHPRGDQEPPSLSKKMAADTPITECGFPAGVGIE